jgi:hypothetical protein
VVLTGAGRPPWWRGCRSPDGRRFRRFCIGDDHGFFEASTGRRAPWRGIRFPNHRVRRDPCPPDIPFSPWMGPRRSGPCSVSVSGGVVEDFRRRTSMPGPPSGPPRSRQQGEGGVPFLEGRSSSCFGMSVIPLRRIPRRGRSLAESSPRRMCRPFRRNMTSNRSRKRRRTGKWGRGHFPAAADVGKEWIPGPEG